jgi:hypothetical protein
MGSYSACVCSVSKWVWNYELLVLRGASPDGYDPMIGFSYLRLKTAVALWLSCDYTLHDWVLLDRC